MQFAPIAGNKNRKDIRKLLKILWFMFLAVIILTAGCLLLLQTTFVQTFIAGKVADALTETEIDADISFGKIHFKPFNTLIVRDLAVTDPNPCEISGETAPDTLFVAEYISARFTLKGLTGQSISIGSAFVRNARMNLVLEDGDFKTNLARMFRIPAVREKKEAQNREIFHIKDVEVENIRFCMRNATARSFAASPGGIDWNDLDVSGINVKGRHLRLTGKIMSGELDYLTFKEKSGYSVRSLSGRTRTGQGVALIEDLKLTDAWSRIDIPYFCMMYESDKDFADFIDKVRIEGIIRPSRIGMKTIGYFAPGLSGNDAVIDLNGEMHGTVSDFEIAGMNMSTENGGVSGKISGRIAGLPDIGRMTDEAAEYASKADTLVIESNYDMDMLMSGSYPYELKMRIVQGCGHLSNDECASALKRVVHPGLRNIFLCHLSENNNTPEKAYEASSRALSEAGVEKGSIHLRCLPRRYPSPVFFL